MENKELKVVITLDDKIQSLNSVYRAGLIYRGGKPMPYIYKSSEAKKMGSIIQEELRAIDWTPYLDWLKESKYFTLTYTFIFKSGITRRDVDNPTKCIQDYFTRYIHDELGISTFDDSKFSDIHLYKNIIPGGDHEYICISIKPSTYELRYDQIERPEQALIIFDDSFTENINERKVREVMKSKEISYQLCNTKRKIKDHDTEILILDSEEKKRIDFITDVLDIVYKNKDNISSFKYLGFVRDTDKDLSEKINSFGLHNIKSDIIPGGNICEYLKNILPDP